MSSNFSAIVSSTGFPTPRLCQYTHFQRLECPIYWASWVTHSLVINEVLIFLNFPCQYFTFLGSLLSLIIVSENVPLLIVLSSDVEYSWSFLLLYMSSKVLIGVTVTCSRSLFSSWDIWDAVIKIMSQSFLPIWTLCHFWLSFQCAFLTMGSPYRVVFLHVSSLVLIGGCAVWLL